MVVNQKPTGRAMSMPGGLAIGGVTSLSVTLIIAAILAKLVEGETMPESSIGYGVMVLLMLASFAGAMVSCGKIKRQRLAVCLLSGVIYFLTLMAITALFFGGQYSAVGVTALLVLCGSALAILAGMGGKRGGKHRKIKIPNR